MRSGNCELNFSFGCFSAEIGFSYGLFYCSSNTCIYFSHFGKVSIAAKLWNIEKKIHPNVTSRIPTILSAEPHHITSSQALFPGHLITNQIHLSAITLNKSALNNLNCYLVILYLWTNSHASIVSAMILRLGSVWLVLMQCLLI